MIPFVGAAAGFLGKNWKVFAIGGAALALWLGWSHYQNLVKDNVTLKANNAVLTGAVETQQKTIDETLSAIDEWETAHEKLKAKIQEMQDVSEEARAEERRLNELFAKHDLEALARAKPGLIERRINAGTRRIFRMLEVATTNPS